jgi:hypothetical protein
LYESVTEGASPRKIDLSRAWCSFAVFQVAK